MKSFANAVRLLILLALPFVAGGQVGNPAPNFTVTDTHGNTHTLYDYLEAGQTVVLDFFFTTCGPCQFYSPQVNLAYEKYGCNTADVFFLSIDYEDNDALVLAYDEQYGIQYPSISGDNGGGNGVIDQYGVLAFPTFYVIDASKTIVEVIDPPTLQVFDFRFGQLGIQPADCSASAAVQETRPAANLELSPNPVPSGRNLLVRLPGAPTAGLAEFEVLNLLGQTAKRGTVDLSSAEPLMVQVGDLPAGTFLLKVGILDGTGIHTGLFVKE